MRHHRITRAALLGVVLAALAAPAATAQQDLRNPDTRDAAAAAQQTQDLRSPDARDAAEGRGTYTAPEVTVVKLAQPAAAESGGIDWRDAGIGAGSLVVLVLVGVAGTAAVLHRRQIPNTG